jgi:2-polyprenyl-3-methyl-5-hydroxy-6-metoxy-1,4-benzoquinol methylase
VARVLRESSPKRGTIVDVGCGEGGLAASLLGTFERYVGCDLVSYQGFPEEPWASFVEANLDEPPYPLASGVGDAVVAVETIEHLENPRCFMRELTRIAKPGGLVIVTTPNQLSLLAKATLLLKNQFNAFQDGSYPAHITALLELDLLRIAGECGLVDAEIHYTNAGRIPFTARHWPGFLRGRTFSDNVLLKARRP